MKNPFKIPNTPRSLPSKLFPNYPGEYTWEDWEKDAKASYPIRYFLSHSIPAWWSYHVTRPIGDAWYWLKSHTFRRRHLLDLRQPWNQDYIDQYRYGYIDPDTQLLFAAFNILVSYVQERKQSKYHHNIDEEGIAASKKAMAKQHEATPQDLERISEEENILKLYIYWTEKRKAQQKHIVALLRDWSYHRLDDKKIDNHTRWDLLQAAEKEFDEEEDDMLHLLVKIRKLMWL